MLDIKLVRENPKKISRNLEKRNDADVLQLLDDLIIYDREWRKKLSNTNELRHERRKITNEIASRKKAGKKVKQLIDKARKLDADIDVSNQQTKKLKQRANHILMKLPNLLHESVPIGRDEKDNVRVRLWGVPPKFGFKPKNHLQVAKGLGIIDDERGAKVAGHGFLYLKNELVLLDMALQRFAIDFMLERNYELVEPPFMMRKKPYEGVTDLSDFEGVMYKIEKEDLFLIATAEHPLAAMFMNEVLLKENLPIKLVGISPCFRKEVGTHGKYTKGLFRMHQFNKVEQFIFCLPEESWNLHEELQQNAEKIYQALGLHHEVVNVCTGDIGSLAAKRYDINIWMVDGIYREVGSNSNCTDYQARRLNIRYRAKEGQAPIGFVHTVNNTAIATSRTMLVVLEQCQQEDGSVQIPLVLTKFMDGLKVIETH
ncbi:serine--tRNA ligase [Candidatus Bathyarchaeota archaeon]|nr:MAG: serine--tRNA ligase [Candidatus Bathyarchaeota archaeon]